MADPVTSIPIAFFPHPTSHTPSPVHTVVRPPPAHTVARPLPVHTVAHLPPVFLDLEQLVDEDAKMSLNPFREHIPHLRRLPLPYIGTAMGIPGCTRDPNHGYCQNGYGYGTVRVNPRRPWPISQ